MPLVVFSQDEIKHKIQTSFFSKVFITKDAQLRLGPMFQYRNIKFYTFGEMMRTKPFKSEGKNSFYAGAHLAYSITYTKTTIKALYKRNFTDKNNYWYLMGIQEIPKVFCIPTIMVEKDWNTYLGVVFPVFSKKFITIEVWLNQGINKSRDTNVELDFFIKI